MREISRQAEKLLFPEGGPLLVVSHSVPDCSHRTKPTLIKTRVSEQKEEKSLKFKGRK
jgi:hypothetical protein